MNTGMNLVELAQELERRKTATADFIAPQGRIEAQASNPKAIVLSGLPTPMPLRPHAHGQLADELGIPKRYYDRMLESGHADLLAQNINTWLREQPATKRMVRTIDGTVRAVLSSSYRPLDNVDLAEAAIPILVERKAQVVSTQLTETRMYLKAILPELSDEVPEGLVLGQGHHRIDIVQAALTISNSEVGAGAVAIEPSVYKLGCTNMLIIHERKMRKYHVGKDQGLNVENIEELLLDDTRRTRDVAFWKTVRDVIRSAFNPENFRAHVAKLRHAAGVPIETDDLAQVVELTSNKLGLPEKINNSVLKALATGGDLSQWGLANAYTFAAGQQEDYDLTTTLERAGGQIVELTKVDWQAVAGKAA